MINICTPWWRKCKLRPSSTQASGKEGEYRDRRVNQRQ